MSANPRVVDKMADFNVVTYACLCERCAVVRGLRSPEGTMVREHQVRVLQTAIGDILLESIIGICLKKTGLLEMNFGKSNPLLAGDPSLRVGL